MKDKIVQSLKTKYKALGFSDKAFDVVATLLEGNITEEAQIDAAIDGVESLLKTFQAEADSRATLAIKKQKQEKEKAQQKQEDVIDPAPKSDTSDEMTNLLRTLTDTVKTLSAEVTGLKSGKVFDTRKAQVETTLKDCPESVKAKILRDFSRITFEKDEDFEAYLTETEQDIAAFTQESSLQALTSVPRPVLGSTNKDGISSDTANYIANITAQQKGIDPFAGKPIFDNP